jgi:hypothetical protein
MPTYMSLMRFTQRGNREDQGESGATRCGSQDLRGHESC